MKNNHYDIVIIGGGAGGMSAAIGASKGHAKKVLLLERGKELGGILLQCIHNGFGLHHFKEELSGPGYAEKLYDDLKQTNTIIKLESVVTHITKDKHITFTNPEGLQVVSADHIILTSGSRERTRHQIDLPGQRLTGIMTAGQAQLYLNIEGYMVGKKVFILGSGDIGLIMARRMTLEGATVLGVAELMPYSNGLNRNIVQCLEDYDIPLYLSHTITNVLGTERLEKIELKQVDENLEPIDGTEKYFEVDTLLLSVGLMPETNLIKKLGIQINPRTRSAFVDNKFETNIKGVYVCGNALHIHDLVDYVSEEGELAGEFASKNITNLPLMSSINIVAGQHVNYTVPSKLSLYEGDDLKQFNIKFRIRKPIEKAIVYFKQGDHLVRKLNKTFLIPSEMESINIPYKLLKVDSTEPLTVSVEEVKQ